MARTKAPKGDTEFGGGPGLIDPERRKERVIGQAAGPLVQGVAEELWEIYATNPARSDEELSEVRIERP